MKALLVDCLATVDGKHRTTPDVIGTGPRYVASIVENLGWIVDLIEIEVILLNSGILKSEYDVLMISAMSSDLKAVKLLISMWRNEHGDKPVILGGPISFTDKVVLLDKIGADIVVVGEAEKTLQELFPLINDARDKLRHVKGIAFKHNGKRVFTGYRERLSKEEYNSYTPEAKYVQNYRFYKARRVYVEVVRGCSNFYRPMRTYGVEKKICINCGNCFSNDLKRRLTCPENIPPGCGYCSVPLIYGYPKSKNINIVFEEIRKLVEAGVKRITLSAPDFLDYQREELVDDGILTDPRNPPANTEAIEKLFEKIFTIPEIAEEKISVSIENVKACLVTEEVAKLLGKYLRGSTVNIGFETGSFRQSRFMGRPSTPHENLKAIKLLRKYGLRPYVYFMHGLPKQSRRAVDDTIKAMRKAVKFGAERIIMYKFVPLPETAFEGYRPSKYVLSLSRVLVKEARRLNRELKNVFLGKTVKAIVASKDPPIAYMLKHGPYILLKGAKLEPGTVIDVKIEEIKSSRLVSGRISKIYKC
ncbi:B12-binding domain-containing radical SAM protein [archaeon]|nr:MAG: B12-binding domain-containing radical SAM protein [archaeon]RLG65937.1 MAG: B12-binding domain-containing radical SAM protein [archaeon]